MTQAVTTNQEIIQIHVLNSGVGESIIVGMPEDKWGVVDCYSRSIDKPSSNPTLTFLKDRDINELEFLCLTHPHEDHFRGMSHLLNPEMFTIKRFWRFGAFSTAELKIASVLHASQDLKEAAREFQKILRKVTELREAKGKEKSKPPFIKHVESTCQLYPEPVLNPGPNPIKLKIWSLAPSGDIINQYQSDIGKCFDSDGKINLTGPYNPNHNDLSFALLIIFGETRIILGGDVERKGWQEFLRNKNVVDGLSAHVVKVSHHGSTTGYTDGLWEEFSSQKKPYAVITPYYRHHLPNTEAISHISNYASSVLATRSVVPEYRAKDLIEITESPIKAKIAMAKKFSTVSTNTGCCSIYFNDRGGCVKTYTPPPAVTLK